MHESIEKQEYIKLLKSHQMALVFFRKEEWKKDNSSGL